MKQFVFKIGHHEIYVFFGNVPLSHARWRFYFCFWSKGVIPPSWHLIDVEMMKVINGEVK